jgi:hypothetical protein
MEYLAKFNPPQHVLNEDKKLIEMAELQYNEWKTKNNQLRASARSKAFFICTWSNIMPNSVGNNNTSNQNR